MNTQIKKISQEFSKGNFPFTYEYMSDNIQWNVVGVPPIKGKKEVVAYCDKMMKDMANSTLNNTNYIVGDQSIAVQGFCDYVNEQSEPGRVEYCDVYRFDGEQLIAITSYVVETSPNPLL